MAASMTKARKKPGATEPPTLPQVSDKVTVGTNSVYEVAKVHHGGNEVDLQFPGTNLMRFRVPVDKLTYVERKAPDRTSNPFTTPEPVSDPRDILERVATVKEENLKRLDGDVDILKAYLKTQHAPMAAIEALEGLTVDQHMSWKKAVERIKKLLEE